MKLILENVRTFVGRHEIPIRPLTVLIGENSTGKTTLLAMLAAVSNNENFPIRPNFNTPPFNLGNYDTIATQTNGTRGVRSFAVGFETGEAEDAHLDQERAEYASDAGYAHLLSFEARADDSRLSVKCPVRLHDKISGSVSLTTGPQGFGPYKFETEVGKSPVNPFLVVHSTFVRHSVPSESIRKLTYLFNHIVPFQTLGIAPIRSKPQRVYSEMQEAYSPTGDHVPFSLEELLDAPGSESQRVLEALTAFGNESGLFTNISVRRLGKKPGEPFQLTVGIAGRHINLVDVGYGVSQVLPVIVQTVLAPKDQVLLLQQPEVHLHPKAQAALGSFFSQMAGAGGSHMIVETHSDYIIDRIRQEVAKKTIAPEKVGIIYFQKRKLRTSCHLLELDEQANFLNVPPDYHQFFLDESLRLLKAGL